MDSAVTFLDRHRGPFRLHATRPHPKKRGFFTSEWLTGTVDKDDVASEALALLDDPRDTITAIHVWSTREHQFVGGYRKRS